MYTVPPQPSSLCPKIHTQLLPSPPFENKKNRLHGRFLAAVIRQDTPSSTETTLLAVVMDTQASTWYPLISYGSVLQPLSRFSLHKCCVEDAHQWWNLSPQFLPMSQKLSNYNSPQVTPTHFTQKTSHSLIQPVPMDKLSTRPWLFTAEGSLQTIPYNSVRLPHAYFNLFIFVTCVYHMHILIFSFVVQTILCLPHAHFNFSITLQTNLGRLCCGQTLAGQAGPLTAGSWKIQAIYLVRN